MKSSFGFRRGARQCSSVEFLVTSFINVVSPGTGVLYMLAAGLSGGSVAE
jgi:hypothetical protein